MDNDRGQSLITKYVWVIETIYRRRKISFKELNELWLRDDISRGVDIPKRTFDNWRHVIWDMFLINIVNENRGEYRYYIENEEDISKNGLRSWLYKTPVKLSNACGLYIKWIDGEGEEDNDRHYEFVNPLTEKAEDRWDKIADALNRPSLYSKLEEFSGVVHIKDYSQKYVELQKQYSYIAEHAFFGGYFEVNNKRRIYPTDIEFYYHEEDADGLKDPIMYHTDDHEKKKLEYYPLSSLNFHMSGLDVTFENKKMNYRASFLIREYKVCDFNGKDWVETKGNENRSTYIYEDMLMNIPLSEGVNIRWIDSPSEKEASWEPVVSSRINVANYVTDTEGSYIKEEIDKNAFDQLPLEEQKKYFSYSGKKFKRCNRMWNFHK